jgi:hypothetical protein
LNAFTAVARVAVSPRRFTGDELGTTRGMAGAAPLDCIVTFDQAGGKFHFCVAHRWGDLSSGTRDQFRNIATILAHQAIIHTLPEATAVLQGGEHDRPSHRELIREINGLASRFQFYRHSLPWLELAEAFCRVDMAWNGTRFVDPDFGGAVYAVLPAALRQAAESKESAF